MKLTNRMLVAGAMLGASVTGVGLGATMLHVAGAQTGSSSSEAAATAADAPAGAPSGPHAANGITEEVLTGDAAAKVSAAALDAVPGATVDRVETDAEGATYEAHVTKSDGTKATVKLDADFNVSSVEAGMR